MHVYIDRCIYIYNNNNNNDIRQRGAWTDHINELAACFASSRQRSARNLLVNQFVPSPLVFGKGNRCIKRTKQGSTFRDSLFDPFFARAPNAADILLRSGRQGARDKARTAHWVLRWSLHDVTKDLEPALLQNLCC